MRIREPRVKGCANLLGQWDCGDGDESTEVLTYKFLADCDPDPSDPEITEADIRELRRERTAQPGQWYWEYTSV